MMLRLSDKLIEEALEFKGLDFKSTKELTPLRDVIGFLGQTAVTDAIKFLGEEVDAPPYFSDYQGDEYDFFWRNQSWDVKSSPLGSAPPYCPKCRYLIKQDSKTKKVNNYVFTKVAIKDKSVYITGYTSYNRFWRESEEFKSKNVKYPCNYILGKDLLDFKTYATKTQR